MQRPCWCAYLSKMLFFCLVINIFIITTLAQPTLSENQRSGIIHTNLIGGDMTSYVETLLVKHVKLSSIDEAKLTRRQVSLDDSLSLLQSLSKELDNESANAKFDECVCMIAILTTVVSDIVRDSVGAALSKTNKLMELGLKKGYDKARDYKWKGNRNEALIKSIEDNARYLEELAKIDKTGATQMVVTIHKHMLMNFVGLQGFTEDSKEARMALSHSMRSLKKNIKALEEQRQQVKFYLDTGAGAAPQQMFTPQQHPGRLP